MKSCKLGVVSCKLGAALAALAFAALPARAVPDGLTHVGIRAHSLHLGEGAISLPCTVDRVIDNVFSYILMLQTPGAGQLRIEFDKAQSVPPVGAAVRVHVPAEEILLLE